MVLSFVQLSAFSTNWRRLGLADEDLRALERMILHDPVGPPIMKGTGGLRKIRYAPRARGAGKSGGVRVCYAYFPVFGLVYLCAVFPKNEKANLTREECVSYKKVLDAFDRYLREHWTKGWTP